MRNITAETFNALLDCHKAMLCGGTPFLIAPDDGRLIPVRVHPECGRLLKIECYGGGTRWYCPRCDVHRGWNNLSTISYTNSPPPASKVCQRPA